jgi:hypothetical protein
LPTPNGYERFSSKYIHVHEYIISINIMLITLIEIMYSCMYFEENHWLLAILVNKCYTLILTYCWKWREARINLAIMLYIITDILLKVAFNTNKIGHHVKRYNWHLVESGGKDKKKLASMFNINTDTLLKVAINTNKSGHHVIRYNWHIVESRIKHQ